MSSKGTTQFFQSGLSKWLQNYNRFIPFVSFRRRGQSIDRVGSLLKHKSSAFFVCVFQALGCWEINDWLKLKLPWEVVGFCVVWMGFGTFLGVLLVFFLHTALAILEDGSEAILSRVLLFLEGIEELNILISWAFFLTWCGAGKHLSFFWSCFGLCQVLALV